MKAEFDYAQEFKNLDLNAVIKDLHAVMTDSQMMPTDFGRASAWPGTPPETASTMDAAEPVADRSASPR